MKIGTYYYPEQWPREQWDRDFDNIAAMGMQIVHMAEFAWHSLEPRPGQFQFDWLDHCVEACRKRKMDVILCTPTAAPPIWLSAESPETLPIDKTGTHDRFGGRRHYNPLSQKFRDATTRIVTAMADRWGQHPSIIGWQIDNEYMGAHDQSTETHAAFRAWLQRKYQSIENLNKAWGNQFWNSYYENFDQILFPAEVDPVYRNPHAALDGQRFWSWAYADFNKLQTDILKPRVGDRFITHNFMNFHRDVNPADFAGDLNLFSWDAYPVTGWGKQTDQNYRMGYPDTICLAHDYMASFTGRWAQMELQPGQTNWSGTPTLLYPGAVRLWIWTAFAHGAEFVTTYRWRQPRFGVELFHQGLITPDGVTPSPGGREFKQVIKEMKKIDLSKIPPIREDANPQATIGLVFDFDQLWWYATLPQAKRWDQLKLVRWFYEACARIGLKVKIINAGQPIPHDLPIVIAPGLQMVDQALIDQFNSYANAGGRLLLTCRTALMDRTGQIFEGPTAAPIASLIGAIIEAYDGLPEETFGQVELDGKKHPWSVWGDLLYAEQGTRVLARYTDQFYAGTAAVTQKKHGSGSVTYCGVYGEYGLISALVEKLAKEAKLPVTNLPTRVHLARRGPYRILLNYQDAPTDAPAPRGAKFLIGQKRVEPAGVAIWEE